MKVDFESLEVVRDPMAVKPGDRVVYRDRFGTTVDDLLWMGPIQDGESDENFPEDEGDRAWWTSIVWTNSKSKSVRRVIGKPGHSYIAFGDFAKGRVRIYRRSIGDTVVRSKELAR